MSDRIKLMSIREIKMFSVNMCGSLLSFVSAAISRPVVTAQQDGLGA